MIVIFYIVKVEQRGKKKLKDKEIKSFSVYYALWHHTQTPT